MKLTTITPDLDGLRGLSANDRATVHEILADLGGAADRIRRAGEKWVALSAKVRERVLEAAPPTWRVFLQRLELVGAQKLHPQLYSSLGKAATWLGKLPLAEQDRYLRERIPVVIVQPSGRQDVRLFDIEEMGEAHREQVFRREDDGAVLIRDVPQQKAWLELKRERQERAEERHLGDFTVIRRPGRWRVEKGKLYPDKGRIETGYTIRDIKMMAKDLAVE